MLSTTRLLACAALAAGTWTSASLAASTSLTPTLVTNGVTFRGVVTLANLGAAVTAPAAAGRPVAMPAHRYPDGSLMRTARSLLPPMRANSYVVDSRAAATTNGGNGIYEGLNLKATGGELEPPDQGLAVNNGEVFEIVNNTLQIYSTAGKALSAATNNATFFGTGTTYNLSDPHVTYDPTTQRWFVEELIYSSTYDGFVVAISQTSDPLGAYYVYDISAATNQISACGGSCLPDYPQIGYDANGFYITADLFSNFTGQFVNAAVYALPKSLLETGASFTYVFFQSNDFVIQPSTPAPGQAFASSANGTEYLMSARNILDGTTNMRVFALSNTAALPTAPTTTTLSYTDVPVEAYTSTVASTEPNNVGPYGKSLGATTSPMLDGGYNSIGGGVKYAANKLYGALTTGTTDSKGLARDQIAYFVMSPQASAKGVKATVAAQGYVVPPTGYSTSFPSFALAATGNGIMGFSITNKSATATGGYPSGALIQFAGDAPSGKIIVTGQGNTSDDGFTGYGGSGPAGVGRWGDYGGGTVDPVTGYYYVANEYIPDATKYPRGTYANWGTFISQAK